MTRDEIYNTWRHLVQKHTKDGCCNFQNAASELAFIAVAAERQKIAKAAMSAAKIAIEEAMKLEREACAKVCDEVIRDLYIVDGDASEAVSRCAAAIRARGEQEEPK